MPHTQSSPTTRRSVLTATRCGHCNTGPRGLPHHHTSPAGAALQFRALRPWALGRFPARCAKGPRRSDGGKGLISCKRVSVRGITGAILAWEKNNGFVMPTETNLHEDALCFMGRTWARHGTTEALLNNGWRLAAVGGWWRSAVGGGWWTAAGSWRLAVGGWRLAVGGWWSLGAVPKGAP